MFTFWPEEEKQFMNKIAIVKMHIFAFNGSHCWEKEIWVWNSVTSAIMDVTAASEIWKRHPFSVLRKWRSYQTGKLGKDMAHEDLIFWVFLFLTGRHAQPFQEQNSYIFGYLWMCHLCGHIMDWLLKIDVSFSFLILKVKHFFLSQKIKNKLVNYKKQKKYHLYFHLYSKYEASEIFLCCVFVYLVTLAGNLLIITTISASTTLGTPYTSSCLIYPL